MPIDNSKYTILPIRSTFENPENITHILQEAGFHVCEAKDLSEATAITTRTPPDLILINIDKASKEDAAMLRKLKSNKTTCSIPVLFIASMTNENYIPQCLSYDNTDFILHPFRPEELVIRLQHQLLLLRAHRTIQRQNKKLRSTLEARDKLYSVIAHDLRAPIGTIKMINSCIENQKNLIKEPKIRKFFEMINETTEEAFNLLENLLRWTRTQNGKTKVYATSFNISLAINQVSSLFKTIAEAKHIIIHHFVQEKIYVYADEDMVKTVLRNLLSNAVKFTYPGGKIEIAIQETPLGILTSVKDNGKGIPADIQTRLLKNNEYITTFGTRNEKGSGLGLILCRDFIEMNKGKFCFSSQEGVGSTFYFLLPATAPDDHPSDNKR